MTGQAGPSVNEQELWDLFGSGRYYADVRARIAQLQQGNPSYTPSSDLLRQLDIAEAQQHLGTASEGAQWQTVIDQARQKPDLLSCARTDTVWRTAEAFARLQQTSSAFDLYRSVIGTCSNLKEPDRDAAEGECVPVAGPDDPALRAGPRPVPAATPHGDR